MECEGKTFLVGFGTGRALVAASLAIFDSRAIEFPTMKRSYASPSVFHDLLSLSPPPPIDLFINTALLFALLIVPMKQFPPPSPNDFFKNVNGCRLLLSMNNARFKRNYIGYMNYIFNIWAVGEKRGGEDVVCFVSNSGNSRDDSDFDFG